uniref:PDEase domain-containing protein n=1 Tax=Mucochytrium quahogii TaxID=96639 RepID=A0A7S2SMQ8_9STRA|mmetsp:Transcript_7835/g.17111  ORF Transcript_7835/g.17111 Transcript_7835/m.17111 type:complete len:933 (+) Transcript_7835:839-3637(+)
MKDIFLDNLDMVDLDMEDEDVLKELNQCKQLFGLTAKLNSEATSTSKAIHELVNVTGEILNVDQVTVYLCTEWNGKVDDNLTFVRSEFKKDSKKTLRVLQPVMSGSMDEDDQGVVLGSGNWVTADPLVSAIGNVAHTKKSLLLNDIASIPEHQVSKTDHIRRFRNVVMIPINFCAENCVGVLEVANKVGGFTPMDKMLLESIASTTGCVIHQILLVDQALTAQRKASALLDLANASRYTREDSHIHMPNLINRLVMSVYKIMRADRVSLYLCDTVKRELWCCISKDYLGSRIPFGVGIIGTVANSGEMLNIHDCYSDRRFSFEGDRVTGYRTRSMLAVPVFSSAGNLVAVLVNINKHAISGSEEPIMGPIPENSELQRVETSEHKNGKPKPSVVTDERLFSGITHFTRDDELVLESISTEIGNVLERNALDAHYENVVNEVLGLKQRTVDKVLTASLLAETTHDPCYQENVAERIRRSSASFNVPGTTAKKALFKQVSRLAYFFRAIGMFMRMLKQLRGFRFSVKTIGNCECPHPTYSTSPRGSCAASTPRRRRISSLKSRDGQWEGRIDHVGTTTCAGAQYILDVVERDTQAPIDIDAQLKIDMRGWCLNVFSLDIVVGVNLVREALEYRGLVEAFHICKRTLTSFTYAVKDSYLNKKKCSYHNWDHALGVFQMCYALLCQSNFSDSLTKTDELALLVAALGHDAGHQARTNDFEIKTGSPLAVRYNDRSVLEQYHAATLFSILNRSGNNILQFTSKKFETEFRKVAIDAILATDMSSHFEMVKKVGNRVNSSEKNLNCPPAKDNMQDRIEMVNFVLHCIDIGGQTYPRDQSDVWSSRLIEEFIAQVNDEVALGLEPTTYMVGLEEPLRQAYLQKSFTENIVLPAWKVMAKMFDPARILLNNLEANICEYNRKIQDIEKKDDQQQQQQQSE